MSKTDYSLFQENYQENQSFVHKPLRVGHLNPQKALDVNDSFREELAKTKPIKEELLLHPATYDLRPLGPLGPLGPTPFLSFEVKWDTVQMNWVTQVPSNQGSSNSGGTLIVPASRQYSSRVSGPDLISGTIGKTYQSTLMNSWNTERNWLNHTYLMITRQKSLPASTINRKFYHSYISDGFVQFENEGPYVPTALEFSLSCSLRFFYPGKKKYGPTVTVFNPLGKRLGTIAASPHSSAGGRTNPNNQDFESSLSFLFQYGNLRILAQKPLIEPVKESGRGNTFEVPAGGAILVEQNTFIDLRVQGEWQWIKYFGSLFSRLVQTS
jgi:hypothetical protein